MIMNITSGQRYKFVFFGRVQYLSVKSVFNRGNTTYATYTTTVASTFETKPIDTLRGYLRDLNAELVR